MIIGKSGNIELIHQSLYYGSAARSAAAVQQKLRLIGKLLQIISEYEFFLDPKETLVTYNQQWFIISYNQIVENVDITKNREGQAAMDKDRKPLIFDTSDGQELRINTINTYLKKRFGKKVVKLSLDGGFTCPNRDGGERDRRLSVLFRQWFRRHGLRLGTTS